MKKQKKTCAKCGELKSVEDFNNQKVSKDGKHSQCRECSKEYYKQWEEEHKEEKAIKDKQYKEEHKREIAIRDKQYYQDHKEERKQYIKKHKEEIAIKVKQYSQTLAGKESSRKTDAKRSRELNWVPLNKCFNGSDGHHVDVKHVIYIPDEIHNSIFHCLIGNRAGQRMDEMNEVAFDYLFSHTNDLIVPIDFAVELKDLLLN